MTVHKSDRPGFTLPTGWRSSSLLPLWALAVATAVSLGMGALLNDPTTIRFVLSSGEPATSMAGRPVILYGGDPSGTLDTGTFDDVASLTVLTPDQPFQLCTTLPKGLSSSGAARDWDGWQCWSGEAGKRDVVITLGPPRQGKP